MKTLKADYDLTVCSNLELAITLRELCQEYDQCYHEISTATCDVWESIERVAKEIARRDTLSQE